MIGTFKPSASTVPDEFKEFVARSSRPARLTTILIGHLIDMSVR
jgi:hypothetical protein